MIKKAQVTLFMIIGIVILVGAGLFIGIKSITQQPFDMLVNL